LQGHFWGWVTFLTDSHPPHLKDDRHYDSRSAEPVGNMLYVYVCVYMVKASRFEFLPPKSTPYHARNRAWWLFLIYKVPTLTYYTYFCLLRPAPTNLPRTTYIHKNQRNRDGRPRDVVLVVVDVVGKIRKMLRPCTDTCTVMVMRDGNEDLCSNPSDRGDVQPCVPCSFADPGSLRWWVIM
jgi:hypothetical protein